MKDSPNLDLLRTVAVCLVVLSHLGAYLGWGGPGYSIETMGRLGVAIFFVHTCLVLMLSMERNGAAAVPFFIRRFFRIYPLAAFTVLFVTAIKLLAGIPLDRMSVLSNLLLIQNITGHNSTPAPLWSLPYEVQMYLLLPALFLLTRKTNALLWVALVFVSAIAVVTLVGAPLLLFVPCFVPGIIAFTLRGRRRSAPPALLFLLVAAGVVIAPALVAAGVPKAPVFWVLCFGIGFTIPACRELRAAPIAAAAKTIATYSYGIYLTHWFALHVGFSFFPDFPTAAQVGIFLLSLLAFSVAAYRWIERRGIALGARLADQVQTKTTGRAVTGAAPLVSPEASK